MEQDPAPESSLLLRRAKVLEGALDFMRRLPPRIVVFEALGPRAGGSEPASISILQEAGYRVFALPKALVSCRLMPLAQAAGLKTHDFVAISPGCEQPVLEKLRLA